MDPADTSAGLATRVTHALKLRRQPTTRYDEATKALTETANEASKALEAITSQASKASRSEPTGTRPWRVRAPRRTGACRKSLSLWPSRSSNSGFGRGATASGAARGRWPCR